MGGILFIVRKKKGSIFFNDRRSVFSQWAGLRYILNGPVWVLGWVLIIFHQMKNCFSHEKALLARDLLKAREIMDRIGRES